MFRLIYFGDYSFGAAYPDGYGINCMYLGYVLSPHLTEWLFNLDLMGPDVIKFGIESKHSSPLTSTDKFKAALSASLREMKSVCLADFHSNPGSVVSHL